MKNETAEGICELVGALEVGTPREIREAQRYLRIDRAAAQRRREEEEKRSKEAVDGPIPADLAAAEDQVYEWLRSTGGGIDQALAERKEEARKEEPDSSSATDRSLRTPSPIV